jgi:CubicO group peptidase (beta-lactamase class C family)
MEEAQQMKTNTTPSMNHVFIQARDVTLSSRNQHLIALMFALAFCVCLVSDSGSSELNHQQTETRGIRLSISQLAVQQPTGTASAGLTHANNSIDLERMEQNILDDLTGKAVGFAYVISNNGISVKSGAQGWAKLAIDNPNNEPVAMTVETRIQTASISRIISTIAILQLLETLQLSIDEQIAEWLPEHWELGANIQQLTFRQLLTHRSGFKQQLTNMNAADQTRWGNDWDGLQFVLSNSVEPDAAYADSNTNYALLRIIIPQLWKATDAPLSIGKINKWNHGMKYLSYLQQHIFIPMGIESVTCWEQANYPAAYAYQLGNPDKPGHTFDTNIFNCGGHAGLHLSALELSNLLDRIDHDDAMLSQKNRVLMGSAGLGWDHKINTRPNTHQGKLENSGNDSTSDGREIHHCVMKYPHNIVATVVINSDQLSGKNQCDILRDAFDDA